MLEMESNLSLDGHVERSKRSFYEQNSINITMEVRKPERKGDEADIVLLVTL